MAKRSLLARLSGSLKGMSPDELSSRRNAAEAALAEAERLHGKAALAAEQELPGSAQQLVAAVETLQLARDKVRDVLAAQIESEALQAEQRRAERAAQIEKQDKASRAVFAASAKLAREGEAIIADFANWYATASEAEAACRREFAANPRLRSDLAHVNLADLVGREITRVAVAGHLPPGPNVMGATLGNPQDWPSLGSIFAGRAEAVLPPTPKAT